MDKSRYYTSQKHLSARPLCNFEIQRNQHIRTGKILICFLSFLILLLGLVSSVISLNPFYLIFNLAAAIALLLRVSWVRYAFSVVAVISCISVIRFVTDRLDFLDYTVCLSMIPYLLFILCNIICCFVLLTNPSLNEYLRFRKK